MSVQPTGSARRTVAHTSPLRAARACGCAEASLPTSLLEFHVDLPDHPDVPVSAVGVGYELRRWRADALAEHVIDWVPDFALRPEERDLDPGRVMAKLRRAYRATFGTARSHAPAEILLHALCREFYGSSTLVHKVVFKTADKDTYKGFDGVHAVHSPNGGLELWLGEAKFYTDLNSALRSIGEDLETHLNGAYLKNEFAIVGSKVDPSHPHYEEVVELLRPNQSIERIFSRLVVPVFVTYDSPATAAHKSNCSEYDDALRREATQAAEYLRRRVEATRQRLIAVGDPQAGLRVQVRLFLLPMDDKKSLEDELERRLVSWLS